MRRNMRSARGPKHLKSAPIWLLLGRRQLWFWCVSFWLMVFILYVWIRGGHFKWGIPAWSVFLRNAQNFVTPYFFSVNFRWSAIVTKLTLAYKVTLVYAIFLFSWMFFFHSMNITMLQQVISVEVNLKFSNFWSEKLNKQILQESCLTVGVSK